MFAFKLDEAMIAVVYVASIGHVVFGVTLSSAARKREYDLLLYAHGAYMGVRRASKTLAPSHVGDNHGSPTRAKLVLRAWVLHKFAMSDFASGRAARRKLFIAEVASLRGYITDMSSEANMTTGNKRACGMIVTWAPMVFSTR